jgi:hypothetical protein
MLPGAKNGVFLKGFHQLQRKNSKIQVALQYLILFPIFCVQAAQDTGPGRLCQQLNRSLPRGG